ncbi:DUF3800 domain-containing protein [Undibacterium pigrum]|uniref:Uncharacterized protein DUF3800 n=1 Tax=Undibacterium pigrum TaxID=401470 RepID=A0A318JIC4_9BURK|nr:DUF3800 domain-containing protein [Undibacterium pigrum]PXX46972.1 uncharacterized protein DUF3800 [Undibacterium pigrum]
MHIFCDESGNTGSDLLNKEQPLFSLASTCLDADVAAGLVGPLLCRGQTEAKYSKLKSSVSGQKTLIEFFMSPELSSLTGKVLLADKRSPEPPLMRYLLGLANGLHRYITRI